MGVIDLNERASTEWLHDCFRRRKAMLDFELAEIERLAEAGELTDEEIDARCASLQVAYKELDAFNIDVVQPGYFRDAVESARQLTTNAIALEQTIEAGILVARSELRRCLQKDLFDHVINVLKATDARWQKFYEVYEPDAQRA